MGLEASIEVPVKGARAIHTVDVLVEGQVHGLPIRWIVECKAWRSRVTKEKALTLLGVVQDIGADKGILVSESGFQPGAIAMANNSNLTMIDVAELQRISKKSVFESGVIDLCRRHEIASASIDELVKANIRSSGRLIEKAVRLLGSLLMVEEPLHDVRNGSRKSVTLHFIDWQNDKRTQVTLVLEEFVRFTAVVITDTEQLLDEQGSRLRP